MDFDEIKEKVSDAVVKAIREVQADASDARDVAGGIDLDTLRLKQSAKAAALAAPNVLGGPAVIAAILVEVPALMRVLSTTALGTGIIIRNEAHKEDFMTILGVWSGDVSMGTVQSAIGAQFAAAGSAAAPAALHASGAIMAAVAGAKMHLATHALTSTVTLAASKQAIGALSVKAIAGPMIAKWVASIPPRAVPLLGAAVGATVNTWMLNSLMDAAQRYYRGVDEAVTKYAPT
ncbi:MAG: hypothetical protein J0L81_08035 [Caulobacterales bacterium]|jgi:hypothetical protein|nr:hypothetical protein [Caulobacterales bacterium]